MRYHHTTSNRLFKAPVTVQIRSVTFSSFFACSSFPMDWCGHTRGLSGYPLQKELQKWSCYVMFGHIRLYYNHEAMWNAVKCFKLKTQMAPEKICCSQMLSDKLINSPQNIDPVLHPREARNRPSHLEKKSDVAMKTVRSWSMDWLRWGNPERARNHGVYHERYGSPAELSSIRPKKLMYQLTENISESGGDHCLICRNNIGFRSLLEQMGRATSRTIKSSSCRIGSADSPKSAQPMPLGRSTSFKM